MEPKRKAEAAKDVDIAKFYEKLTGDGAKPLFQKLVSNLKLMKLETKHDKPNMPLLFEALERDEFGLIEKVGINPEYRSLTKRINRILSKTPTQEESSQLLDVLENNSEQVKTFLNSMSMDAMLRAMGLRIQMKFTDKIWPTAMKLGAIDGSAPECTTVNGIPTIKTKLVETSFDLKTGMLNNKFNFKTSDLGPKDKVVAPNLIKALGAPYEAMRLECVKGLGKIRDKRAVEPLKRLIETDSSPLVRKAALESLQMIWGVQER